VTSLVAAVVHRTGKIIKYGLSVFWKRRKLATKWYTLNLVFTLS